MLNEKAGETMALALHELATNAVKYGALASRSGKLSICWKTDDGPLALEWRESGLRVATPMPGRGYGRELIEVALPFALGAKTNFDLRAEGVACQIELPQHDEARFARARGRSVVARRAAPLRSVSARRCDGERKKARCVG